MAEPRPSTTPITPAPETVATSTEQATADKRKQAKLRFDAAQARALASEANLRLLRALAKR
jgi:hypothetical protein